MATGTKPKTTTPHPTVSGVSISQQMQKSYLDYAMSVIVARALPDVRDGLKPVQRRIIYAMHRQGMNPGTSYKKCAAVVGEVMKEFHPHGDLAIYHTLVRMAQEFSLRIPLIDGQGNFGSIDGDSPAAMRYTECRLAPIASEMLADINQDTVDFRSNYSGEAEEPTILPALFPNLLVNGSSGIAVGMATNIPPHNLNEIINATIALIKKGKAILPANGETSEPLAEGVAPEISFSSEITIEELMAHLEGPDFPTGGNIYDVNEIVHTYTTGKGRIIIRGIAETEEIKGGKMQIVVTQLPYQVNKANLVMKIADLVKREKIKGISDLRDESNRDGIRMVIELKRDIRPQRILNQLYKHTDLEKSFNANLVALVNGEPKILTLKQILTEFVKHRQIVTIRRTLYLLKKAKEREHILEGLMIALNHLDAVIDTIKKSPDAETAKTNLMTKFKLTEIQAQAILDMQLRKLAALEQQKIKDELADIKNKIANYQALLGSPQQILDTISKELAALKDKYGDERRTKVYKRGLKTLSDEDLVPEEDVIVTLTESGYIKRLNVSTYKTQGRGGKGVKGMKTKEEDVVSRIVYANTHDKLLFFTNRGKVYSISVHEIPEASRTAKGTALVNVIDILSSERPQSIVKMQKGDTAKYLIFATKKGNVKRTALAEFDNIRKSGKIAIRLKADDELSWVHWSSGSNEIILTTAKGMSIRFGEKDLRPMGRSASGVRGIRLKHEDLVVGMAVVDLAAHLLVVSKKGYGKLTKLTEYTLQKRGGTGILTARINDKTGSLVSARMVTNLKADVLMTSSEGQVVRVPIKQVSILGRATQGVKLINLSARDNLAAITIIDQEDGELAETINAATIAA